MVTLTLADVKRDKQILSFISQSDLALAQMGYTDHGLRHLNLVADRAGKVAKALKLKFREQEIAAIAGFCHDMGNFMGRTQHHYWGALLFSQVFQGKLDSHELTTITQAIANHDKEELKFTSAASAIVVIADKSDVHRSRVRKQSLKETLKDIHDRVNYAATFSAVNVNARRKQINLTLKIDTRIIPILEYFEIFTERMSHCRKAADFLGYKFGLTINKFKLL